MKYYTFENINLTLTSDNEFVYDLFEKTVVNNLEIPFYIDIVTPEHAGRIDLLSEKYYGSNKYIEELLVLNNILNPYTIKAGDNFIIIDEINMSKLHQSDDNIDDSNKYNILNINNNKASNKKTVLPPSVNPGLNQLTVDYNTKKITVLNKLK